MSTEFGDRAINGRLCLAEESVTIATGAITITQSRIKMDTEAAGASDDLDTINGAMNGAIIFIYTTDDARDVVVKHDTGNIKLNGGADITLDTTDKVLMLVSKDGTNWTDSQ